VNLWYWLPAPHQAGCELDAIPEDRAARGHAPAHRNAGHQTNGLLVWRDR
jgi:hypothetical protein